MDAHDTSQETEAGRALFAQLLWVHRHLRRDLETVERLAAEVADGLPGHVLQRELDTLRTAGPLWQLQVNCLRYCSVVHQHHGIEDAMLFPTLRDADPALSPVVDRLESDHRRVSDLLDVVEHTAGLLTGAGSDAARLGVVAALQELHAHLLEHLDFEELSIGPAMRRMTGLH